MDFVFHEPVALLSSQKLDRQLHTNFQGFAKGLSGLISRQSHLRIAPENSLIICIIIVFILSFLLQNKLLFHSNSYIPGPVLGTLEGMLDLFLAITTNS